MSSNIVAIKIHCLAIYLPKKSLDIIRYVKPLNQRRSLNLRPPQIWMNTFTKPMNRRWETPPLLQLVVLSCFFEPSQGDGSSWGACVLLQLLPWSWWSLGRSCSLSWWYCNDCSPKENRNGGAWRSLRSNRWGWVPAYCGDSLELAVFGRVLLIGRTFSAENGKMQSRVLTWGLSAEGWGPSVKRLCTHGTRRLLRREKCYTNNLPGLLPGSVQLMHLQSQYSHWWRGLACKPSFLPSSQIL